MVFGAEIPFIECDLTATAHSGHIPVSEVALCHREGNRAPRALDYD